jgi:hypothetical protein
MPFSNLDHQKIYYYVLCVMAFFVLMWGAIDLSSASIGLLTIKPPTPATASSLDSPPMLENEKGDQFFETYYQKKMLSDRFWDSLARVIIAGGIFAFCRVKVSRLEEKA